MFEKATKEKAKLRLAIYGASGSGKTYSALSIAKGMGGKIALIDSERGSANKYADRFDFDIANLEEKTVKNYINYINSAKDYNVLIIDSLSHAWAELLEMLEDLQSTKYKGSKFGAWKEITPLQKKFIDTILTFPGHIIATMRSKTDWVINSTDKGMTPQRMGLAPEQGKGIEYEFDVLMEINPDHKCFIQKDRTGKYQDAIIDKPGEQFGKELIEWLNTGADPKPKQTQKPRGDYKKAKEFLLNNVKTKEDIQKFLKTLQSREWSEDELLDFDNSIRFIIENLQEISA
jgi:hypothetical protein